MAGEVLLINPRRRGRHRRKKARSRRRRARRRNPGYALMNPRRRRRSYRRRYRRNPRAAALRIPRFFGIDVGQAAMVGAGFIGTNIATAQLMRFLPADWQAGPTAPMVRIGAKLGVTVAGTMLIRSFNRQLGNAWAIGGAVAAVVDLASTFILPAMGLADYETGLLTDYEPGMLTGTEEGLPNVDEGGAAYGNGAYG